MLKNIEKLEGNMVKLTIEISAEDFKAAIKTVYQKNKAQYSVPGFRKGKVPQAMIEKMYGEGIFYNDALDIALPQSYAEALDSEEGKEVNVVARPEIEIESIGKDQPVVYTATVAVEPEVTLGAYKDLGIEKKAVEVTDEDVQAELEREQKKNARTITVEDRAVADGDTVNIDYAGFVGDEQFEGGTAEGQDLKIGSHSFIDTFEDQLVGKNIGDEVEVNVTFPAEYHADNLAGKPAVFKVKINGIKAEELPELNDEFAEEVSDFDTLEEYKEDLKKKVAERKQDAADRDYEDEVLKKAVENASMDIPQPMIEAEAEQMVNEYAQQLSMQGLSIDMYCQYMNTTKEQMAKDNENVAAERIKSRLTLKAIAAAENVEVSDEEVTAEMQKMADAYQMKLEDVEKMISDSYKDQLRQDLSLQKALKIITE